MCWIIEAQKVTKYYPSVAKWRDILRPSRNGYLAVDDVDLRIAKGELFGLVGPNGAGKTTLIKLLSTLIIPSSGKINIAGYDIQDDLQIKKSIGLATSDERSFYWRLTGRQNLQFFAKLNNLTSNFARKRIEEIMELVNLIEVGNNRFHTYSTGMRQRLAIARAILTNPKIVILDEPTKGLDPPSAANLHKLIRKHLIGEFGVTVLLTSHHLKEIEDVCDRIAVMNQGKIQGCGTIDELRYLLGPVEEYRLEAYNIDPPVIESIENYNGYLSSQSKSEGHLRIDIKKDDDDENLTQLIKLIIENNGKIRSISCNPISLRTIFDHLTQKSSDGMTTTASVLSKTLQSRIEYGNSLEGKSIRPKRSPTISKSIQTIGIWVQSKARIAGALIKRDMLSETSYRFSFFMQIVEIFLTIAALYFLSKMLGHGAVDKHLIEYGGDYFSYALIGVAFYSYFNIGFSSFAAKLQEAQSTGTLEAMLSTPADLSTIVLGSSLWRFIMTTIRVLVFLLSGAIMFESGISTGNLPLAVLILIMTMVSASSFGIMSASFVIVVKRGDPISWLFKSASWILGGVVFPVTVLPLWMQKLSVLLPTVHALKAIRLVLLQGAKFNDVRLQIFALCVFCFLLLPISLRTLKYAVRRAKKEGTLTHY